VEVSSAVRMKAMQCFVSLCWWLKEEEEDCRAQVCLVGWLVTRVHINSNQAACE